VGANYAEANNASSRADFKNKIFIAKKEASETRYWLRVIAELTDIKRVALQLEEIQQILLILQKITNTLRDKALK
jgi:four helix bundle protein